MRGRDCMTCNDERYAGLLHQQNPSVLPAPMSILNMVFYPFARLGTLLFYLQAYPICFPVTAFEEGLGVIESAGATKSIKPKIFNEKICRHTYQVYHRLKGDSQDQTSDISSRCSTGVLEFNKGVYVGPISSLPPSTVPSSSFGRSPLRLNKICRHMFCFPVSSHISTAIFILAKISSSSSVRPTKVGRCTHSYNPSCVSGLFGLNKMYSLMTQQSNATVSCFRSLVRASGITLTAVWIQSRHKGHLVSPPFPTLIIRRRQVLPITCPQSSFRGLSFRISRLACPVSGLAISSRGFL